ncbi:MAG: PAS domain-containing protein [Ignavibacteriae bacterium]|nr:PAS domain-containing protein [Ignavibacteriota bacterium]
MKKRKPDSKKKRSKKSPARIKFPRRSAARRTAAEENPEHPFPIVGIGASAGGLEAFMQLFKHLPNDTGMGFVVVQHLAPEHESMLREILSRGTKMPVTEVTDGIVVEQNHVYVIPPKAEMAILEGRLRLASRQDMSPLSLPIDHFFRSLAEDIASRAIGIVLSGTASDGAQGIKAIKAEGGITFVQDEETAKYHGMPRSAIETGYVDFILPPEKIAQELVRIAHHPLIVPVKPHEDILPDDGNELAQICLLLRREMGVDFSQYKAPSLKRRILRRMVLHRIETPRQYFKFLQSNRKEVEALHNDILISVTGFFRDPDSFKALSEIVFPNILKDRDANTPIRIWVPGCSTGEEAYSIAMTLLEYLSAHSLTAQTQIFATDVSATAIEKARAGFFLEGIANDVPRDLLRRHFTKVEGGYQINKGIRDLCVFAKQNMLKDPPFSKLDLISCRNVLIYFNPTLQQRLMTIFHYALKPNGFLLLGTSESIGTSSDLFTMIEKKAKIYVRKTASLPTHFDFAIQPGILGEHEKRERPYENSRPDLQRRVDQVLMSRYAPASVVINEDFEILHFRGRTGNYLEPAPGMASFGLLKMAREGLISDLRSLVLQAKKSRSTTRKEGVSFKQNGNIRVVNLEVVPIAGEPHDPSCFLVVFEAVAPPSHIAQKKETQQQVSSRRMKEVVEELNHLRSELAATKEHLQSTIEEREATNEELRSANEEIQSSYEELQSTNEELETAKEELQSTNEELTTVNEELENRNAELHRANSDVNNLLNGVNIPIIILGSDLRIRHFTPASEKLLHLIPGDIGRRLSDLKASIPIPDLQQNVLSVVDSLQPIERKVQDAEGQWHLMRLRPYKTTDNKIDGVVFSLINIDEQKHMEQRMRQSEMLTETLLDTVPTPAVMLDAQTTVTKANSAFYSMFRSTSEETEGKPLHEILKDGPELLSLVEKLPTHPDSTLSVDIQYPFAHIGERKLTVTIRRIALDATAESLVLLLISAAES